MKDRNDVGKQWCKWQYLNLGMFFNLQQYFSVYGTSTLMCICVCVSEVITIFSPSSSSLFLPQSPLHSINIACVHLTLPPFWSSLAFFLQRINPFALLTCLFFFFYLMETLLWSDSICSNTQLSDAQPHGPGRFEVDLVLTAGFTPFHQVSVLSKLYKKRFGSKKKKKKSWLIYRNIYF